MRTLLVIVVVLGFTGCVDAESTRSPRSAETSDTSSSNNRRQSTSSDRGAAPRNAGSDRVPHSKEGVGKGSWRH